MQVGDYGTVNKETGEFLKNGNIYEDDNDLTDVAKAHPPEDEAVGSPFVVMSRDVESRDFEVEPEM
jgi:hypothetical protein